jgi:hypothetical protein
VLTQLPTALTRILAAGPSATDFGRVAVTGVANFAGGFSLDALAPYVPAANQVFAFASYASHLGQFNSIHADSVNVQLQYGPTAATAVAPPPQSPAAVAGSTRVSLAAQPSRRTAQIRAQARQLDSQQVVAVDEVYATYPAARRTRVLARGSARN